ncbi:hypothetical protein ACOJQI_10630 [Bacillus salacetis]|uniref:hypothetical protein n=1 Tax=Bacillus salacetis TaxID=2315464 RepID=UPI003BA0F29D
MTPILKYNLHLLVFFFSLMYFTFGQQLGLPVFLMPILFILMIFGFIFSAVVGERFKKGIDVQSILVSKLAWTFLYVTVILTGSYVFNTIKDYTVEAFMPFAVLYIAYALVKLYKTKKDILAK